MTEEEKTKLYKAAMDKWGADAQVGMMQEECIELALAIRKCFRDSTRENYEAFIDEVADVKIMVEQMEYLHGDEIQKRVEFKLNRLKERLE